MLLCWFVINSIRSTIAQNSAPGLSCRRGNHLMRRSKVLTRKTNQEKAKIINFHVTQTPRPNFSPNIQRTPISQQQISKLSNSAMIMKMHNQSAPLRDVVVLNKEIERACARDMVMTQHYVTPRLAAVSGIILRGKFAIRFCCRTFFVDILIIFVF